MRPVARIHASLFSVCIALSMAPTTSRALNQGDYTYTTNVTGQATITGFNASFSGALSITNALGGCPVTSIDYRAFFGCTGLTAVSIPGSVTAIGYEAFRSCSGLKNLTIGTRVTSIGTRAFAYCANLTAVTIPGSVTSIGDYAFQDCTGLTTVTIPGSVAAISNFTFTRCTRLKNLTIGTGVTSIGNSAFANCTGLTTVTIPNGVILISPWAFYSCEYLTTVTIPASVTYIDSSAFVNCFRLTSVFFKGDAPGLGYDVFGFATPATIYYLPGTGGWGPTFGDRPTAFWHLPYPLILNTGSSFGVQTNGFGFTISWASSTPVVVEACTNLSGGAWRPLQTNALDNGVILFRDPSWTNFPARYYRIARP